MAQFSELLPVVGAPKIWVLRQRNASMVKISGLTVCAIPRTLSDGAHEVRVSGKVSDSEIPARK
jgi:hypothetical protein